MDAVPARVGGDAGGGAVRGGDAPHGARPRARGERADGAGLLELQPRVGGARAAVARLLPRPRPDAPLRVHEAGVADPPVVPAARAVGAEVAPAPGADRATARDVS